MSRFYFIPSFCKAFALSLFLGFLMPLARVNGQNITVNPGAGSYPTLKAAFDAINAGTHTGAVIVDIIGNTDETTNTATLNASGTGSALYTSVLIRPSGGAARTITGATTAGSPMIDLSGADNVTIDGLNTGGNALTISNTTVSAVSGTCTIRFINGATNNTVTNTTILGSSNSSVALNGGNIFFSTDAATANGNDDNTISNCNIGPAGANLPSKAIVGNGSSTTAAILNSGIIITNNNIFDYFAPAASSAGIAVNGGCSSWTISDNRFYQTAIRTWTTGSLHTPVGVFSSTGNGAQGFTITGNIIGYASSAQTGTYSLTGAGASAKFVGILFNGIATGTTTSVNNNTIASVSMTGVTAGGTSTASPFTAILLQEGNFISNGNTIGSQSATGSLTFSTTTISQTEVYGILNFSSNAWTCNNNNVGGISVTNLGASGTFILYGMRAFTASVSTWTASGNTIGGTVANSIQLNATGTNSQILGMFTGLAPAVLTSNTVRNLTSVLGTGTVATASVIGISITTSVPNHTLSQNTIYNLSNTNTTAASTVTGIQFTGAGANVVERNFVHSLTVATNSTGAEVNGIRTAGGTTIFRNNMIALGAGISNAIGAVSSDLATQGINGINDAGGNNSFFHNSVYIGGSPTVGNGSSYAFNGTVTNNARSYHNNIFFNARSNSGATGKNYAVKLAGSVPNPSGLTINNNIYLANGSGGVFGFYNSLDVANLAAWKTAVGQDALSFSSNPQYIDPANATPDLHIHPTNATPVEGNGADVGVLNDYDGQTRSSLSPVDIGADAGNFTFVDLTPPTITYTLLANTALTTNRMLSVTITDATGVAAGGVAPHIYFNKNGGAWFSTAATLSSGTVLNGVWNATINHSLLGGVVTSDVIRYYVVAQDLNGNLGANPVSGLVGSDVNNIATPPSTPNQYTIVPSFSGNYNVGIGQTYTSLTNAGGIFEAINAGTLTGNVTINITSDLTGELGTNPLNQWLEEGPGNYTLTIRPSGGARTITGSNTGAFIRLFGADRVTIDGSTTGASAAACQVGGNPALRELTIQNMNTSSNAVVLAVMTGNNGAQNNTIKNINILGQDVGTLSIAGIAMGGNAPGTVGADNDNNRIENCSVKKALYGIYSAGNSTANRDIGTTIIRNDLSATGADRVRRIGILLFNTDNALIHENSVGGVESSDAADVVGIGVGTQLVDNATTADNNVTNSVVSGNRINGVVGTNTTGFSAAGIAVYGGSNTLINNTVTGVLSPATSPDLVAGIHVSGSAAMNVKMYYNSVSMTGNRGAVAGQTPSFALAITGIDAPIELKNNIFYTTQTSGGGAGAKSYAIGMVRTAFANFNSDYNDYWSTGANDGGFRTGSLAASAGTDYATLAAFAAAVSDEAHSLEVDPTFIIPISDLHLVSNALACKATPIAGVTTDFDCQARSISAPTIGADEIANPLSVTLAAVENSGMSNDGTICNGASVNINSTVTNGVSPTYMWNSGPTTPNLTGLMPNANTTYIVTVTSEGCQATATQAIMVNPAPATFNVGGGGSFCGGGSGLAITLSGSEIGVNYQLQVNNTNTGSPTAGTGQPISFVSQTTAGTYTIIATNGSGCTAPMNGSATITVNPTPNVMATPASQTICSGNPITTIALSGNVPGTVFNWARDNNALVTGIASSGTGDITGSLTNTTNAPITVTFTISPVANGCPGSTAAASVVVNPGPTASVTPGNQTICSGSAISQIVPSGSVSGTTFDWVRDNTGTVTGISASGSGNITGSLTNTTNAPVTVNFTVTPSVTALVSPGAVPNCTAEAEPNNSTATANVLDLTAQNVTLVCNASISPAGDVDYYRIDNVAPGSKIWLVSDAGGPQNPGASSRDNVVDILASDGTTVIESDDDDGTGTGGDAGIESGLSASIAGLSLTVGGTYYIRVKTAFAGAVIDPYTLLVVVTNSAAAAEVEGNNTAATANTLVTLSQTVGQRSGSISPSGDVDYYSVEAEAGNILEISLDGNPERDALGTDLVVEVRDPADALIITFDGSGSGNASSPVSESVRYNILTSGTYYVKVRGFGSSTGTYGMMVGAAKPSPVPVVCTGAPVPASVVVNPVPNAVASPSSQTVCSGTAISTIVLSGNVAGTVFNWVRNNTATVTGIASSGAGDISGTLVNNTNAPVTVTFTFTPVANNCTGSTFTASVVVNPGPTASVDLGNQTICSGSAISQIVPSGPVPGTTFNWVRDNTGTVTGISASGSGNITGSLTNTTNAPVTVNFTVTPSATALVSPGAVPNCTAEAEPNNTVATANLLDLTAQNVTIVCNASISPAGDVDYYRIDNVAPGSKIWLVTDTGGPQNPGAFSYDNVVDILASDGTTILESDDDDGTGNGGDTGVETGLSASIAGLSLTVGGTYYIRVKAAFTGSIIDPYTLLVVVTNSAATAEVEGNNTAATANTLVTLSQTVGQRSGAINPSGDMDYYSIEAEAGNILEIAVDSDPERDNSGTNLVIEVRDPMDTQLLNSSCDLCQPFVQTVNEDKYEAFDQKSVCGYCMDRPRKHVSNGTKS